MNYEFGGLTPKSVGMLLKEMVRRAIELIQARQFSFETEHKENPLSGKADIVTSVDQDVQQLYLHLITQCLPDAGVIAEEEELRIAPSNPKFWVTIDPLDGTRAFVRGQSHGVGTMVAALYGDEICSAYVGDVNTREIYGYRPGGERVHHITQYNVGRSLVIDHERTLASQWMLTRMEPSNVSTVAQSLFLPPVSRLFQSYEITSGSIGIELARLWKGEVGAVLISPGTVTPWDFNPVVGISDRLDFAFLSIDDGHVKRLPFKGIRDYTEIPHEILICHASREQELTEFLNQ